MIRALLMDIGDVLVGLEREEALFRLDRASPLGRKEIAQHLQSTDLIPDYERGRLTTPEFFQKLSALLQTNLSFEAMEEVWNSIFYRSEGRDSSLISADFLGRLRMRFPIFFLSNTNESHFEFLLQKYTFLEDCAAGHILSYRIGSLKPADPIFQAAIQIVACEPQETLFIDDLKVNVAAARRHGLRAIHFRGQVGLEKQLRSLGLGALD